MIAAAEVKPEITGFKRKFTKNSIYQSQQQLKNTHHKNQ